MHRRTDEEDGNRRGGECWHFDMWDLFAYRSGVLLTESNCRLTAVAPLSHRCHTVSRNVAAEVGPKWQTSGCRGTSGLALVRPQLHWSATALVPHTWRRPKTRRPYVSKIVRSKPVDRVSNRCNAPVLCTTPDAVPDVARVRRTA
jgi:hypothetical protein